MSEYIKKIKDAAKPIIENLQLELVDVVLRKEFGINVISIIIDDPQTFSMDIDQLTNIHSQILDIVNDDIPDGYYLELTTCGIERELKTPNDFQRAINQYIYLSTYQKIHDAFDLKEMNGTLIEVTDEYYVVEVIYKTRKKIVNIPKTAVAKIRLAVKF